MTSIRQKPPSYIQVRQKIDDYYKATEPIRKQRMKLRNCYIPKITVICGKVKCIYPEEYNKLDAELEKIQNLIWEKIFKEK